MAISPANGAISIIASGQTYQIRPAPLFSLSVKHNRNKIAYLGSTYDINLNGYIIDGMTAISGGTSSSDGGGGGGGGEEDGTGSSNGYAFVGSGLKYILTGQSGIASLFSKPDLILEISDVDANAPVLIFTDLQVNDINFEEGQNFNVNKYSVSLTANNCSGISAPSPQVLNYSSGVILSGYNLEDFNETWSIDVNDSFGFESSGTYLLNTPRSYTATRTIAATSRVNFNTQYSGVAPWQNARSAIQHYLSGVNDFDQFNESFILPSNTYTGYNHSRTENTDKSAGSYTITDSWFIGRSGDTALENYTMSINSSRDNPYVKIAINGTVKGLSPWSATSSGQYHAASGDSYSPYNQALKYYYKISNSGLFGPTCKILKRIQSAATHRINPQPLSISLGTNELNGEITYSLDFDNRPLNYFSGVMLETISINDTYPGDVFAVIPVLGRPTGPILQFTFGRTEYKRDISIEILLDYTDIGYNQDRAALIQRKPSINEPLKSQLNELIRLVSPGNEVGIRKYFLSNPPTESWNPKEGRYTLSLGWVYELSE